ncbi:MAG: sarcosine oxidase subunit gamma [Rhizobiaceae bacterium]|nr:sarcosine oxidase subunit gamma [Rhizobiaceae bacterium]MCV0406592.1 sarcosine oxidase subunit gamma [Rhizobiaceae bacterium]
MAEPLSPLGDAWRPGSHGNFRDGTGVTLTETRPGSIVQVTAWPDTDDAVRAAIRDSVTLDLPAMPGSGVAGEALSGFGIGPGRYLLAGSTEGLETKLRAAIAPETGAVTDLSHGRAAFRIQGESAEWVLSKLFALDFAEAAFPLGHGRATQHHHDITALIQRTAPDGFDLYFFRSFARSFWHALCRACEDVGYEVR